MNAVSGILRLFFLLITSTCIAQQFQVELIIKDLQQKPLDSVKLTVDNKNFLSDSAGRAIVVLQKGKHSFLAEKEGYNTEHFEKKIEASTTLNISLKELKINLNEVQVEAEKDNSFGITRLNSIEGTAIYAGKKSEVIVVGDLNANLASNNQRQLFSKIAGINIFESDGGGLQLGIGGRGLNPNRVSNFNTRQNGYDISADALGYPESYYSPPSEAIERIEILRGAASLQYGTQFGGFINFKFRQAPENEKFHLLSRQTYGSFGFLNSFNNISGTVKKFKYFAYAQYKRGDGWKPYSKFELLGGHISLKYDFNEKLNVKAEYTLNNYLAQQPGGLTDKQFKKDPFKATRTRNWFKVDWNLFATELNYKINDQTKLNIISFGLLAGRDALGFLGRADRRDDTTANRTLLSDKYKNFGSEVRLLHHYNLLNNHSVFLIGTRYYNGNTIRRQGLANNKSSPDFEFLHPEKPENSDYVFPSRNYAVFTENLYNIGTKFSVTPGLRFEYISTQSNGYYNIVNTLLNGDTIFFQEVKEKQQNNRKFFLGGIGLMYKPTTSIEIYSNFSQNYRSINFNDMRVVNPNLKVDPNLKDETGYTADAGCRLSYKNLLYADVSVFYLRYNNRIGTILASDDGLNTYRLRTNVSDSRNIGVESFIELNILKLFKRSAVKYQLNIYSNVSYIDARYLGSKQTAFQNKMVELVPAQINRYGISFKHKKFGASVQYSSTSEQFTDASNTKLTADGSTGLIPEYRVIDCSAFYNYKWIGLSAGINNVLNEMYFTRRADGYPGPGIIPSDPRNFYCTLKVEF